MGKSFEFKECERFLKRVLKDKGMYSKGAVIAFLITGGIGFVAPVLVGDTVQAKPGYAEYVITDPRTGETVTEALGSNAYFSEGNGSVILANSRSDAAGTDGIYGRLNRRAIGSVIIGNNAVGFGVTSTDIESKFTAVGNNARAFGGQGTAIGSNTLAAKQATAIGNDVYAAGDSSVAIGNDDIATKYKDSLSVATLKRLYGDGGAADAATAKMFREANWYSSRKDDVGKYKIISWADFQRSYFQDKDAERIFSPTYAGGTGAIAIGSRSIAAKDGSTAIGTLSYALGEGSTAMGLRAYTDSNATGAVAIGEESRSFSPQSLAVGNHNESAAQGAMSYGYNAKAIGQGSIAIGYNIFANAAITNDIAETNGNSATNTLRQAVRSNLETYSETQLAALGKYQNAVADYYEKLGDPKKYSKEAVATAKQTMDNEKANVEDFTKYGDVNYLTLVRGGFSGQQWRNVTKNTITSVVNEVKRNPLKVSQNDSVYLTTTNADGSTKKVTRSENRGDNAIAIGYYSAASGSASIAQGAGSVVDADSGIGIGSLSYVSEKAANSIAMGVGAQVRKENSIAIGTQASVYGAGAMGLGSGARVYGDNSLAFGYGSVIQSRGSIALGNASKVAMGAQNATSLGANTEIGLNSGNSVTVGNTARIGDEALNSMALGFGSSVGNSAAKSIAFGTNATIAANATSSVALGDSAKVTVASSTALGRLAEATNENSVALGYRSTTHYYGNPNTREASASATESATNVQGLNIKPYLPQGSTLGDKLDKLDGATAGYVSVGGWIDRAGAQVRGLRRIVNVAPGALDTDAVTVAQLRDWTDKSAHFLSIAGASNKSATDYPDINDPLGTKVKNAVVKIKSNFDNDTATGTNALALGVYAYANGQKSVAMGPNAYANVDHGVAIGDNAQAWSEGSNGNGGVAIGKDAKAYYWNALALGTNSNVSGWNSLAMGANARVGIVKTVDAATGNVTNAGTSVNDGVAIGRAAEVDGASSIALGAATKITSATNAVAIGPGAKVLAGQDANNNAVQATGAIALGSNASVTGSQYSVALGLNSSVVQDDTKEKTRAAFTNEEINDPGNGVVSVGNNTSVKRRIINVASGVNDNDAVTVKQLKASTQKYYSVNTSDNNDKTVNGIANVKSNINNDGATGTASIAIGSYAQASGHYATAIGRDVTTTGYSAVGMGTDVSSIGEKAVTIGFASNGMGNSSIALGDSAYTGYTTTENIANPPAGGATTKTVNNGATEGVAIGKSAVVESNYGVAIGGNAKVLRDTTDATNIKDSESSIAIGASAKVIGAKYSVALGLNSKVVYDDTKVDTTAAFSGESNKDTTSGVVSVGANGKYRRILNVAGGVNDNDAVNVKQLKAAAWGLKTQSGTAAAADVTPDTNGKVTLKAGNNVSIDNANGVVTINATGIQSVSSGNANALSVTTTNGAVTITPNLARTVTATGDADKLVTAGIVNTAISNIPVTSFKADAGGSNNTAGVFTPTSAKKQVNITGAGADGTTNEKWSQGNARFYSENIGTHVNSDGRILVGLKNKIAVNEVATYDYNAAGTRAATQGPTLSFTGLDMKNKKITNVAGGEINATSTDAINGSQLYTKLAEKANVTDLANKLDTTAELHVKAGDYTVKDNGEVSLIQEDANGTQNSSKGFKIKGLATKGDITNINTTLAGKADKSYVDDQIGTVSNLGYKANNETTAKQVAVGTGLYFKSGTGTVGATGTTAATTNAVTTKTGIAISTEANGVVNIGLDAATRSAIDNAANKSYVDTQVGNAANKNLSNLNDAGKAAVKDLAAAAVKVAPGKNVNVKGVTTDHVTTYTVDAIDTKVVKGEGIEVTGGDEDTDKVRTYTVGLSADTKAKLAKVENLANTVGTIGADGRDGKAGTGKAPEAADAAAGDKGLTGKDGLNGKDLTTKVNALRNGEAGTVVYTDENGKRVVKANDGKWYLAGKVGADGTKAADAAEVTTVQARLVNPDGTTTGGITKLSNIADGEIASGSHDAVTGGQLFSKLAEKADKSVVDSLTTKVNTNTTDIAGLKTTVDKAITFKGDDNQDVERKLDTTLTVKGATNFTPSATTPATEAGVNIRVEKDPTTNANGLVVKLADTLTNMKGISGNGTNDLVIKNGDNAVITVKPGAAGAKGDVDFGGSKLRNIGEPGAGTDAANKAYVDSKVGGVANLGYKANGEAAKQVAVGTGLHFKSGTGTVGATGDNATTTNAETTKTGIAITTGDNGVVNIGLDEATRTAINNAASTTYVDTKFGNAANKDLSNLNDAGKEAVKDLAAAAVKVAPGKNVAVTPKTENHVTTYTVDAIDTKVVKGEGIEVTGGDENTDKVRTYTVGLSADTKAKLAKVENLANTVGTIGADGRDGKAGTGKDPKAADAAAGDKGLTGKDGLNGKDLTSKVNALRNGEAGTVVYTDENGNRLAKANDGNYYPATAVDKDGNVLNNTPVATTVEADLVNPDGTTIGGKAKLSNIADGEIKAGSTDAINGGQLHTKLAEKADKSVVDNLTTTVNTNTTDIAGLKTTVDKAIIFKGDDNQGVERKLDTTLTVKGAENFTPADTNPATAAGVNIRVEKDATTNANGLVVKLADTLTNMKGISGNGTNDLVIKNGDNAVITVKPGTDGAKGNVDFGGSKLTNIGTPGTGTDAANKGYVDTQVGNAANKNLSNLNDAGKEAVKDLAADAVKVAAGKNVNVKGVATDHVTTYTVDAIDTTVAAGEGLDVTGGDEDTNKVRAYTVGLSKATKDTLAKVTDIAKTVGANGVDGRDGKPGTGADAGMGKDGLTKEDGLNGKDLTTKVNALRNGEAGTVVYTDENGKRVVKANDGKWYLADKVGADGTKAADATEVTTVQARLVNPDGSTTTAEGATGTKLSNIANGTIADKSKDAVNGGQLHTAKQELATALGGNATVTNGVLTGPTYEITKDDGTNGKDSVNNVGAAVEKLDARINTVKGLAVQPLTFTGDDAQQVTRTLGTELTVKGAKNFTPATDATAGVNIRVEKDPTTNANGLVVKLADTLTGMKGISGNGKDPLTIKNGDQSITITPTTVAETGPDGVVTKPAQVGKVDFGNSKITSSATPTDANDLVNKGYLEKAIENVNNVATGNANLGYKANTEDAKSVNVNTGLHFKSGTGTIDATGADATTTNAATTKTGIAITTEKDGIVNIGLDEATRKVLDNAVKLGDTAVDGRDGKSGTGDNAGMGKDGLTAADGLNGKDLTSKVNALRNGEAGTVVYTDENGKRVVKAKDGKWYLADKVGVDGTKAADAKEVTTVQARLVNPDGSTTTADTATGTKLSNIANGTIADKSKDAVNGGQLHTAKQELATALGGNATVTNGVLTGPTYEITKDDGTNGKDSVNNVGAAVEKLDARINTVKGLAVQPLTFTGDDAQQVTRTLGTELTVKGAKNFTPATDATAGVNIRVEKDPTTNANGLVVKLADTLTGMKGISGNGTDNLVIKNGDNAVITVKPGANGAKGDVDFGGSKLTNIGEPGADTDAANKAYVDSKVGGVANLGYKANGGEAKTVAVTTGLDFVAGDGTTATAEAAKAGLHIETGDNGKVIIGLTNDAKAKLDKVNAIAETVGANGVDGRDGKPGTGADAGMAKDGLTGADGLNGKDLTTKVNALRNGEAGTVVYTDDKGNRVVKASDGKWYNAKAVDENGKLKSADQLPQGVTADEVKTPQARLVNPDGTTTGGTTVFNNVASAIPAAAADGAKPTFLDNLNTAAGDEKTKHAAVNVSDLNSTATEIIAKGLTFQGNDGNDIKKQLGETLHIVGEGAVPTTITTAANNIRTKKTDDGKLEIGLAKDLVGITSVTNVTTTDGAGTKLALDGDKLTITNTQAVPENAAPGTAPTVTTVTIGKDGINAGNKVISNVADPTANKDAANKGYVDKKVEEATAVATGNAKLGYKANAETETKKVGVADGLYFKSGTGTIAPTDLAPNTESPTKDTDSKEAKTGIAITTEKDGVVNIGLDEATRKVIDSAAKLGDTATDGRDGKPGTGDNAGMGKDGLTKEDGLNGKDLTTKVNALRNGEAGTVVYTDENGKRVVKANDGKWYLADKVGVDGTKAADATEVTTVQARLVNPDGSTTTADTATGTKLSNIANGTIADKSKDAVNGGQLHTAKQELATALGGNATVTNGVLTGPTYEITKDDGTNGKDSVNNVGAAVEKLDARINTVKGLAVQPLTFTGDDAQQVTRTLGTELTVKGAANFNPTGTNPATAAGVNIRVEKDPTTNANGLVVKLADTLTGMKGISGNGTDNLVIKNGDNAVITVKPGANGAKGDVDFGGSKLTNIGEPGADTDAANKDYVDTQVGNAANKNLSNLNDAGKEAVKDLAAEAVKVAAGKNVNVKGVTTDHVTTYTVDAIDTTVAAGEGLDVTGGDEDINKVRAYTVGLSKATKDTLAKVTDIAKTVGANGVDGRDGKPGTGADAGMGKDGLTAEDGLNGKDLTSKVNALRNGEAGSVVYTDENGNRVVKADDGKWHNAKAVDENGKLKSADQLPQGVTADEVKTPQARLVNPDGTTTGGTTVFNNVASAIPAAAADGAKPTFLDNLNTAAGDEKTKYAAVNVSDLNSTATEIIAKGLTFQGNDGNDIKKQLGETLHIVGEGAVPTTITTAANNIRTKKTDDGKLEIGLAKDLVGITSVTNVTTTDGAGTKLALDGDKLTITNTQAVPENAAPGTAPTVTTVTIGKDGINAGNKVISNVADPTAGTDAANKDYVDTQVGNAANKDLGNLSDDGKNAVKDLAAGAVKVAPGKNVAVTPKIADHVTTYTVDAIDTKVVKGEGIEVTGGDEDTDKVRTYNVALSQATKDTLAKVADIAKAVGGDGANGIDGRDGKSGTGADAGMGKDGLTKEDGLNGKDLTTKVNALRNGEAGTVVYTDENGKRVVKANDGKWYPAEKVDDKGNKLDGATEVAKPQARLVNPDGTTTGGTTKLSNIADGEIKAGSTDAINGGQLHTELGKKADVTALNELADKALTFSADTGTNAARKLGETLAVKGAANFTPAATATPGVNIQVASDSTNGLTVSLADTLTGMKGISGNGTDPLTIKNGDNAVITVKPGAAGAKGNVDFGGSKLTNIGTPDANTDAANKAYVDSKVGGVANLGYKANGGTAKTVALTTGLDFVKGDGTTATAEAAKAGIEIVAGDDGKVTFGLNEATRNAIDNAASTAYVDTKFGNAANKDLDNLNDAGKEAVKDLAAEAVKVAAGKNVAVTPKTADHVTTYTVDAIDTKVIKGDGIEVTGGDEDTDKVRTYTVALSQATKDTLAKVADIAKAVGGDGANGIDGRDGKPGTGADAGMGKDGLTGADGLNGKDLTTKVNALRNGEAGTVVYTDDKGNRIVKASDGKWYPADKVKADGTKADDAVEVKTPQARLVNPNGSTTGGTTIINNVASAIPAAPKDNANAPFLDRLNTAAGDVNTKHAVVNVSDLNSTATEIIAKGLTFQGDDVKDVTRALGTTLTVKGAKNFTPATDATAGVNIRVEKDPTTNANGLMVKLADTLTDMKGISGTGKEDLVIKNGTNTITVTPGKAADGATKADPGKVNFGDATVTVKDLDAPITYRTNGDGDEKAKTVSLKQGLDFVTGDGTTNTAESAKPGLNIVTGENGKVIIGLSDDAATKLGKVDGIAKKVDAVEKALDNKADKSTVEDLANKLADKADKATVKDLADKVDGKADKSTVADLAKTVEGKADKSELDKKADKGVVEALGNKAITFTGNDAEAKVDRKLGETLHLVGTNNITVEKDANKPGTLNVTLASTLTGMESITTKSITAGTVDGLSNTSWDPTKVASAEEAKAKPDSAEAKERSKAATQGQLKDVADRVSKGRVFTADTKVGDKPLAAEVGLGDTLAIQGGATSKLTDNNIGVELTLAKDGKPATMTVKLAKDVKMADGTTSYDTYLPEYERDKDGKLKFDKDNHLIPAKNADGTPKYQVDKNGKPVVFSDTTIGGKGTFYGTNHVDVDTHVTTDRNGDPVYARTAMSTGNGTVYTSHVDDKGRLKYDDKHENILTTVTTVVNPNGVTILPGEYKGKAPVTLTENGLNNGGNTISNVAPGVYNSDAATVGQLNAATNTMTRQTNEVGAHAAALAAMNPLSYDPLKKSQVMAGVGKYKNSKALALGVAHYANEDTMFNVGVSVGGGNNMMNAGVTYRFGGEDSMIPERYKGGPISSVYILQDEVSALKAENAQVKADNEQVKADNARMKENYEKVMQDNEEMKAQIKMLMAHMGIK